MLSIYDDMDEPYDGLSAKQLGALDWWRDGPLKKSPTFLRDVLAAYERLIAEFGTAPLERVP